MAAPRRFLRSLIATSGILGGLLVVSGVEPARATTATWWVAASGTAQTPASSGSSCAHPSYVGTTDEAIQDAIDSASSGDVVLICPGRYTINQTLTVAGKDLSIAGEGASESILRGSGSVRLLRIGDSTSAISVSLSMLNFQNGSVSGGNVRGGAISADHDVTLTIDDSTFINNRSISDHGGAVAMVYDQSRSAPAGSLTISNSTFHRNSAGADGGAVSIVGMTTLSVILNSTFVENVAGRDGGAVNSSFSNVEVRSSTLIDNRAGSGGGAVWSTPTYNSLIANQTAPAGGLCRDGDSQNTQAADTNVSTDPLCVLSGPNSANTNAATYADLDLDFLAPWGGPTPTVAIGASSVAKDAVPSSSCPALDQRGEPRSGQDCDAGAYEHVAEVALLSTTPTTTHLIAGMPLSSTPALSSAGLTSPITFRFAEEVDGPIPGGVTLDPSSGSVSGTPDSTYYSSSFVVSARGNNNQIANVQIVVDNCAFPTVAGRRQITNINLFLVFARGICDMSADYEQTVDLALTDPWEPIGSNGVPFSGTYDGMAHSISGLNISGGDGTALFSRTNGAEIRNLSIQGRAVGTYGTAGLVGWGTDTAIVGVSVDFIIENPSPVDYGCHGTIAGELDGTSSVTRSSGLGLVDTPTSDWVGGLVGCAYDGTVLEESFFDGEVRGRSEVGGLVGWAGSLNLSNSYAMGTITSTLSDAGTLVGSSGSTTSSFVNNYGSVTINGVASVGGLIGKGVTHDFQGSTWESGITGTSNLDPIGTPDTGFTQPSNVGYEDSAMKSLATFTNAAWPIEAYWVNPVDTTKVWGICDGVTRPFLLWQYSAQSAPCLPASSNNNNSPGTDSNSGGSANSESQSSTQAVSSAPSNTNSNVTDSSSATITTTAPATAIAAKTSVGRSKISTTKAKALPNTGNDISGFAIFAMCAVLLGTTVMNNQRRRKQRHSIS